MVSLYMAHLILREEGYGCAVAFPLECGRGAQQKRGGEGVRLPISPFTCFISYGRASEYSARPFFHPSKFVKSLGAHFDSI